MMNERYYLRDKRALAYYQGSASPEFWDQHWKIGDLRVYLESSTDDDRFLPAVRRYLPAGSVILEGGCGRGQIVNALQYHGYRAIGIDYAGVTIERIKRAMPELDVRLGDVRNLNIEDSNLDGYISAGVIEHFWEGYFPIIKEMHRTLREGGFLFISFPFMSPFRNLKASVGLYKSCLITELEDKKSRFYQFALSVEEVQSDLEELGFIFREKRNCDGIKGFKDEIDILKPLLQLLYDGKLGHGLNPLLDRLFKPFASHSILLVMQKTPN